MDKHEFCKLNNDALPLPSPSFSLALTTTYVYVHTPPPRQLPSTPALAETTPLCVMQWILLVRTVRTYMDTLQSRILFH